MPLGEDTEVISLHSEEALRVENDVWDENGFLKAWELWKKKVQQAKCLAALDGQSGASLETRATHL